MEIFKFLLTKEKLTNSLQNSTPIIIGFRFIFSHIFCEKYW